MSRQAVEFQLMFGLGRQGRYSVAARLVPEGGAPALLAHGEVDIDQKALLGLSSDARSYGRLLSDMVFQTPLQNAWHEAAGYHMATSAPLHVRIGCDLQTEELHALRWETLADPRDRASPLALSTRVWLSRALDAHHPAPPQAEAGASPVALVAAPEDGQRYQLAPIDVARQRQHVLMLCGGRSHTLLARGAGSPRPTLENLLAALRQGPRLVYIVAHGVWAHDEVWLWLEDEAGAGRPVASSELARHVGDLPRRPELIILLVCRGAGLSHREGWAGALGARLVRAGVTAVLAMQGDLSFSSADSFIQGLFADLSRGSPVEHAVAVARGAIADTDEWWLPVLFAQSGRRAPGYGAEAQPERRRASGLSQLSYEKGLHELKRRLGPEEQGECLTLEARLRENLRRERLFGGTETLRSERAEIIFSLNELALRCCGVSFNELCSPGV